MPPRWGTASGSHEGLFCPSASGGTEPEGRSEGAGVLLLRLKMIHAYALHVGRWFGRITAVKVVEAVWGWLTGPYSRQWKVHLPPALNSDSIWLKTFRVVQIAKSACFVKWR